jgi:hypothetical protein
MFEEMEAYLKKEGIPFKRHSEGCCEYNAEDVVFDGEEEKCYPALNEGDEVVFVHDVKRIRDAMEKGGAEAAKKVIDEILTSRSIPPFAYIPKKEVA